jgi:hypothetical protein
VLAGGDLDGFVADAKQMKFLAALIGARCADLI